MRDHRRELLGSLPPRRIWLYIRLNRVVLRFSGGPSEVQSRGLREVVANENSGPEDTLIDGETMNATLLSSNSDRIQ